MSTVLNKEHESVSSMMAWLPTQGVSITFDEIRAHFGWSNLQASDYWLQNVLNSFNWPIVDD